MKLVIRCFFGVSIYFLTCSFTIAQESLRPIELLTSPLPIFSVQQEDGSMSGYSVEYAKSVFELAGYEPTVTPLPFARLIRQMNKSSLVVATGIGCTPEREEDFFWIALLSANVIGIFSVVDQAISFDSLNTSNQVNTKISGLDNLNSVAVLRGDYRAEILHGHGVKSVVEFNSWEQAIGAVLKGRVSSIFFQN